MSKPATPLFKVWLTSDFELAPHTMDEVIEFSDVEIKFWSWLESDEVRQVSVHLPATQILQVWRQVNQHAHAAKVTPHKPEYRDQILNLLNSLRESKAPTRLSEDGQIIEQIRQAMGPAAAGAATQFCLNRSIEPARNDHLKGAVAFCAAKVAKVPIADTAMRKLAEGFGQTASETINKMKSDHTSATEFVVKQVAEHLADSEAAQTKMRDSFASIHAENEELRARLRQDLDDFKKFYAQGISLQGPVSYWAEKKKRHRINTGLALAAFVAYSALAWCLIDYFAHQSRLSEIAFWKEAGYGLAGVVAVGVGIVIAVGRLILRLVMSQLHLGNDSDERVTMVKTFLALREGGHADAKSLEIVLTRLFAPTADGIVRDDLGPISPIEALASRLSSK